MNRQNDLIKSRIIIEVNFNEEDELIYKLNKICNELNLDLDKVIKKAIINLYRNIEFIRELKSKGDD